MKLADIVEHLDKFAPPATAEAWDNVGLLVGDRAAEISRAMLCIDYTQAVAAEAAAAGCTLVVAYHPPLFKPVRRVTADGATALIFDAVRRGVAIYSPHTALDVAAGGTNDVLADLIGLVDRRPLRPSEPKARELKLVTFVPAEHADRVADALFAAGAGKIGDYSACSFRNEGTSTFFGEAGTSPAVGQAGRLERASEIRIETVLPLACVGEAIGALQKAHPYETPAFDFVPLAAPPTGAGIGRVGRLDGPVDRATVIESIRRGLGIERMLVAGPTDGLLRTAAVCAGAGDDLFDDALKACVDLYLTGELRHHTALRAAAAGMTVVCTLHSRSERVTLQHLMRSFTQDLPDVVWQVSTTDRDPFSIV